MRATLTAAAAFVLACTGDNDTARHADTAAPSGYSLDAQRAESVQDTGAIPVLTAVRTGQHEGFERIAFEFRGRRPGYRAEYLTGPVIACGSGDTVRVEGAAVLAISFTPVDAHEFDGEQARSSIPERVVKPALGAIREARLTCDFEAEVAWAIGLTARRPMRVWTPGDRVIVVDVATPR